MYQQFWRVSVHSRLYYTVTVKNQVGKTTPQSRFPLEGSPYHCPRLDFIYNSKLPQIILHFPRSQWPCHSEVRSGISNSPSLASLSKPHALGEPLEQGFSRQHCWHFGPESSLWWGSCPMHCRIDHPHARRRKNVSRCCQTYLEMQKSPWLENHCFRGRLDLTAAIHWH